MKIIFLLHEVSMTGGVKVVAIYAKHLVDKGHEVLLVSPPRSNGSIVQKIKSFLKGRGWPRTKADASHFHRLGLSHYELEKFRKIVDKDLPDADVVIATWWETAEWLKNLSPSKGAKVYFIQGYENFDYVPTEKCDATYRLPVHKIVIAKWLVNLMKHKFGEEHVDLVPNSVDKKQFYALERAKQINPTIGFLYNPAPIKGLDITLQVIKKLKACIPNLHVISFGSLMSSDFPLWDNDIEFYYSPAQDEIKNIYAQCDVWITASRSEGFNLTAMEAMACRTPVVSTKNGWPQEAIVDYFNGFLTEVDDVEALVLASKQVLLCSNYLWLTYSHNAYKTVEDTTWAASADMFEASLKRARLRTESGELGNN